MPLKRKAKIKSPSTKVKKTSPLSNVGKKATPAVSGGAGWLTTGNDNIRSDIENQKAINSRRRAPELYFRDGDTKSIRFVQSEPLGKIMQYVMKVNGKWRTFTAPIVNAQTGLMEEDLFMRAGFQPQSKVIYEVIDRTGYVSKQTQKTVKDIPRYWIVGARLYENIEKYRIKYGDLSTLDIEVCRSGGGTDTTYTLIPEPPSAFNFGKIESIADDLAEYYAPPTLEEQKAVLASLGKSSVLDDE